MNTVMMTYGMRNIQKVFKHVCTAIEVDCFYSIEIDGIEIVPRTNILSHFNDFLFYELSDVMRLAFTVEFGQLDEKKRFEFFPIPYSVMGEEFPLQQYEKQNEQLKKKLEKASRKPLIEKCGEMKIMDASDSLVIFVSKQRLKNKLEELIEEVKWQIRPVEVFYRFLRRFNANHKK